MHSCLKTNSHKEAGRRAFTAPEVVTSLAKLEGWRLTGDGPTVAIEKTFEFANYYETISFVNALAFIANRQNHHPDLWVRFNRCQVSLNTHDVGGLSATDFECAAAIDTLLV
jgi:4a-hydroxytetrahydrobiopterin dehydratase